MLTLYVMDNDHVNIQAELDKDGSDSTVSGTYQVNISEWEYNNELGNTVDRIIKEHCYFGISLPVGYICLD